MTTERWRGLVALVVDAVEVGSRAIERVQRETAGRPFAILEAVPPLARAVRDVRALHDASLVMTHGAVRLTARAIGRLVDASLARARDERESSPLLAGARRDRSSGYFA